MSAFYFTREELLRFGSRCSLNMTAEQRRRADVYAQSCVYHLVRFLRAVAS